MSGSQKEEKNSGTGRPKTAKDMKRELTSFKAWPVWGGVLLAVLIGSLSLAGSLRAQVQQGSPGRDAITSDAPSAQGEIEGHVYYHGDIPKSKLADDAGVRRDLVEVDRQTRGIRWVVAHLRPVTQKADPPNRAEKESRLAGERATVDQQDYEFVPRVIAVRQGAVVTFTNSDPANHNVRSSSAVREDEFNIFTGIGGRYEHRFRAQQQDRPVRLGCDIHPWMQGWIYVFDHPHFAVTDRQGMFRIQGIPAGDYLLVLRQPDLGYAHEQQIRVLASRPTRLTFEIPAVNKSKPPI